MSFDVRECLDENHEFHQELMDACITNTACHRKFVMDSGSSHKYVLVRGVSSTLEKGSEIPKSLDLLVLH